MMPRDRCQSKHPTKGTQCGLPAGHGGRHQNGPQISSWDDGQMEYHAAKSSAVESGMPLTPEEREMLYGE